MILLAMQSAVYAVFIMTVNPYSWIYYNIFCL